MLRLGRRRRDGLGNFFFAVGCCCWQVGGMFAQHTKQAVAYLPLCFSARKATKQRSPSARGRDEDSGWRGLAGKGGGARWRRRPGRRVTGWMGQDGSPAREEGEISISNSKTRITDSRLMPAGLVQYGTYLQTHRRLPRTARSTCWFESGPRKANPPPSSQRALPLELPTWSYSCPCCAAPSVDRTTLPAVRETPPSLLVAAHYSPRLSWPC